MFLDLLELRGEREEMRMERERREGKSREERRRGEGKGKGGEGRGFLYEYVVSCEEWSGVERSEHSVIIIIRYLSL